MRRLPGFVGAIVAVAALVSPMGVGTAAARHPSGIARSPLTLSSEGGRHLAHIMPPITAHHAICPSTCADSGPLNYHTGGPIMSTTTTYAIYWAPSHLQSGAATSMASSYRAGLANLLKDIGGHGIYNIGTEYLQTGGGLTTSFIHNQSTFAGSYLDTHAYPASGCVSSDIPVSTNCINDVQLRAEIKRVMAVKGWTSGINHLFLVFTAPGEGSCFRLTIPRVRGATLKSSPLELPPGDGAILDVLDA